MNIKDIEYKLRESLAVVKVLIDTEAEKTKRQLLEELEDNLGSLLDNIKSEKSVQSAENKRILGMEKGLFG